MNRTKPRNNKRIRILILVLVGLFLLLFVLPFSASVIAYESFFGKRYETVEWKKFSPEEFDGLERTQHTFVSDKGQRLVGYFYQVEGVEPRGIIVNAHGLGGGGHNDNMDYIAFFAHSGYPVFAFDATGNDESEGNGVNGLSQGVIDLSYAISFVENNPEIPDLPIVLWGHSWGGYCVSAVLKYHPEVKAVIAVSGFDQSTDLIKAQGKELLGEISTVLVPYAKLYERIKLGKWAKSTATAGFESSDAAIMIVQGGEDTVVPPEYGYVLWKAKYADDPRFTFIFRADRGHNDIYWSQEFIDYLEGINNDLRKWVSGLDYDYSAKENETRFIAEKEAWIKQNLDRAVWCNGIDVPLFEQMLAFYDKAIGD